MEKQIHNGVKTEFLYSRQTWNWQSRLYVYLLASAIPLVGIETMKSIKMSKMRINLENIVHKNE